MGKKLKILVLSDLKSKTPIVLNNAIALSKMLNGDLEFLHVKKPTELVKTASQLSAVREINEYTKIVKKKIKELLDPISEKHKTKVNYKYSFGNVKNEIEKYIKKTEPDIIVLGKRQSSTLSFVGDNIIDFVLKSHKGAILVASHNSSLAPEKDLSVGIFNEEESNLKDSLIADLVEYSTLPLKSFKIGVKSSDNGSKDQFLSKKTIEYVFEETSDVISTISGYIPKSKVNMLCVNRNKQFNKNKIIKELVRKVNVSLLVT